MNFFKIILTFIFLMFSSIVYSDNHDLNQIAQEIQEEEEVPLNDPFAGNEGTTGSLDATVTPEEQEDLMSLVIKKKKLQFLRLQEIHIKV